MLQLVQTAPLVPMVQPVTGQTLTSEAEVEVAPEVLEEEDLVGPSGFLPLRSPWGR